MNKILLGILVGGILGIFDGLTAWFTPEARSQMAGIVVGSTFKGLIAGILIGWFARKVNSLLWGVVFGTGVGMILAFLVAYMGQQGYYFEIMLPGSIVGLLVGYATQRYGRSPVSRAA
jgi:predicted membrane protein